MGFFSSGEDEYVEVDTDLPEEEKRISVKILRLTSAEDTRKVMEIYRKGVSVLVVNVAGIADKEYGEPQLTLKKFKQAASDTGGDIGAIKDNWVIMTPRNVDIFRKKKDDLKVSDVIHSESH